MGTGSGAWRCLAPRARMQGSASTDAPFPRRLRARGRARFALKAADRTRPTPDASRRDRRLARLSRQTEGILQLPRELRPLARLLVFEIDEHLAAAGGPVLDRPRPALDVRWRVAFVPQPEIGAVRGDLDRSR